MVRTVASVCWANLTIQKDKCQFADECTIYLDQFIDNGGIKPNKEKVEAIQKIKLPTTVKEIQQCLGKWLLS